MCRRPCFSCLGQRVGARQRLERRGASPARRWPRGRGPPRAAPRRCAATAGPCGLPASASRASICAHSSRQVSGRKRRACSRTWSARLAMHSRGSRRARPTASIAPSSSSARCSAPSAAGDARHRAVAEQHGLRQAAALEHVQPVGQQRRSLGRLVALPHAQRPAARPASRRRGCGGPGRLRRCASVGAQQLFGQQHLSFPQVGQADDEVAPAAEITQRRVLRRRAAPAAGAAVPAPARPRSACGRPSGWRGSAAAAGRAAVGPRPRDRAARQSGPVRRQRPRRR